MAAPCWLSSATSRLGEGLDAAAPFTNLLLGGDGLARLVVGGQASIEHRHAALDHHHMAQEVIETHRPRAPAVPCGTELSTRTVVAPPWYWRLCTIECRMRVAEPAARVYEYEPMISACSPPPD